MATIEMTAENLAQTVQQGGIVLLDWWAPWCGPCRAFGPIYERAANANPDVVFGKVNTEQQQGLAEKFAISSIPTLMVVRDGIILYAEPGLLPDKALAVLIEEVRKIDMEALRRESAQGESQISVA